MTRLRIVPLDDAVVFPGMPVTLPVDVGSDTHVLLIPRQHGTYARVGVVAEVEGRVRLPGQGSAVSLTALHRAVPGAAATDADGVLRVEVEERPDQTPPPTLTRELERDYRAVVEEILGLRGDDGRISAFVRSITQPGALADTAGYSPDLNLEQKIQLLETLDVVRASHAGAEVPAGPAHRAGRPQADPRRRRGRRPEAAARLLPAQADGRHPQGARRGRRVGLGRLSREDRERRHARGRAAAGRARAGPAGARRRLERRVRHHPHLPRLAAGGAVVEALRRTARPGARPRGARRRSRRPRRGEEADHRVPGGAQAAERARPGRHATVRRHPHPGRPSGNRQDLDRRVDRQGHRPSVRPHVARRRERRSRDPRPSAHLHRRAARTPGAGAA